VEQANKKIPFYNIRIDREGIWYYKGAEMFRREIVELFYRHLRKDESGNYIIELENDCCYLEVEDTAFVIKAVYCNENRGGEGDEDISLLLSDGTLEKLNPDKIWIGRNNILYCAIKNNKFDARFSRSSYYQLAQYINHDPEKDAYFLLFDGKPYYIQESKS
jgi:hypothetical protein